MEAVGLIGYAMEEWGASIPYSELAVPLPLDKLTVVEDHYHFEQLSRQPNIPTYIREHLPPLYGRRPLELEGIPYEPPSGNAHVTIPVPLETFLKTSSNLQKEDKLQIVEQAILLLEKAYVHLPLKRSMYAVNPLVRLKALYTNLHSFDDESLQDDNVFHRELLDIFASLRDLHTNYILPSPYKYKFAYLPFLVEEFFDYQQDETPRFMVTKVLEGVESAFPDFTPGIELICWNNSPIGRIVELNARQQSGSNAVARWARGIDTLTLRPLAVNALPDELRVTLTFRKTGRPEILSAEFDWMVSYFPPRYDEDNLEEISAMLASGLDY